MCTAVSFRDILQSFNCGQEPNEFLNLRSAWADQTASVPRVVMLAVIRSQFVAMRRRVQMPEVDVQSMLHQHDVPIVNDAYHSPPLIPIFVLTIAQTVVHRLSRLSVQLWMKSVQTCQHASRFPQEFCRRAAGFSLARNCSGRYPDRESRKSFRPLKPLFKDCQSRQTRTSVIVDLFDNVRELFGNVGAHHSPASLVSRPHACSRKVSAHPHPILIGMGGPLVHASTVSSARRTHAYCHFVP